jgi:hypothetical protein
VTSADEIIKARLEEVDGIPFDAYAFRAIPGGKVVRKLKFEHLFASKAAGRCNPPGVVRIYLSAEPETASAEFRYYQSRGGADPDLAECHSFAVIFKKQVSLPDSVIPKTEHATGRWPEK